MASGSAVQIEGINRYVRLLQKYGVEANDLKGVFRKVGDLVTGKAQSNAPSVSGRLAASIRPGNTKNKAVVRAGSARVPYAGVINYGWPNRNIEAQGFLTDAANDNPGEYVREIEQGLSALVVKYGLN